MDSVTGEFAVIPQYVMVVARVGEDVHQSWEESVTHLALGEFEQIVLLAILGLDGDVYGVPIVNEIERRTGRRVERAAVYVTLRRLENKGFISSWMSEPVQERGGKPRRLVKIEPAGRKLLRESRRLLHQMWSGLDLKLENAR
jgi:DNA-binding PadR family transcriptional regulator